MPTRRAAVLATALVATLLAPAASAATSCKTVVRRVGLWYRAPAPAFPAVPNGPAPRQVVDWVHADPNKAGRLFVTNGSAVMRSEDHGCTWKAVWVSPVPDRTYSAGPATGTVPGTSVVSLVTARTNRVYLLVSTLAFAPRNQLLVSGDGGATFAETAGALPTGLTSRESLAASWSDPQRVYLVVRPGLFGTAPTLVRSNDGGGSWQPSVPSTDMSTGGGTVTGVTVDPNNRDLVYVWGNNTPVFRSTDGGGTFASASGAATAGSGMSVALTRPKTGAAEVAFTDRTNLYAIRGAQTGALAPKHGGAAVAAGASLKQLLVATGGASSGVVRWSQRANTMVGVTPEPGIRDVTSDGTTFYACVGNAVYRYAGPLT